MAVAKWEPPVEVSNEAIFRASNEILARPDIPMKVSEDIFRIHVVGMDWDIACEIHEPADASRIPVGPDGKRVGMYVLHGGVGDHRTMRPVAKLLAGKFGCKVVCMSYPGRCYMGNENRDWPLDTLNPDGTARTPQWVRGMEIAPEDYEVIQDRSNPKVRRKRGTVVLVKAKEGTEFYYRMAGWPAAFEAAGIETCRRHLPASNFTVYGYGHSTGGPFINMLAQRVLNFAGTGMMESSPFGYMRAGDQNLTYPFNYMNLRTWRDIAMYRGPEQGLEGAMRLPMLMEEILEDWDKRKVYASFKAEYVIHHSNRDACTAAATTIAGRLKLDEQETGALIKQYHGYLRELTGPGVKPMPPMLLGIAKRSANYDVPQHEKYVLPAYAAMNPAPKVRLTYYHAGIHSFWMPEENLRLGCAPATAELWMKAITNGYYVV